MACIKCGNIYEGRVAEVVGDSVRIQDVGLARLSFGDYPRVGQTVLYYDCKGRRYVLPENDLGALLPPPEDTRRGGVFVRRRSEFFDPWEVPVERVFQYLQDDWIIEEGFGKYSSNTMLQVPWLPRGKNILAPPVELPDDTTTQYEYARDGDGKIVTDDDGNPTFTRVDTVKERFWFAPRTFDGVTLAVDALPPGHFIQNGVIWDDQANGHLPWAWGIKNGKRYVRAPEVPLISLRAGSGSYTMLARRGAADNVETTQSAHGAPTFRALQQGGSVLSYLDYALNFAPRSGTVTKTKDGINVTQQYEDGSSTIFSSLSGFDLSAIRVDGSTERDVLVQILGTYQLTKTPIYAFIYWAAIDITAFTDNPGLNWYPYPSLSNFSTDRGSLFRRYPDQLAIGGLGIWTGNGIEANYSPASANQWVVRVYSYGDSYESRYFHAHLSEYNRGANIYEGDYGVIPVPESGSGTAVFCGLEINRAWKNFCADMCVYGKDVYGVLLTPDMLVKITKLPQDANFSQPATELVYNAPLADFLDDSDALAAMTESKPVRVEIYDTLNPRLNEGLFKIEEEVVKVSDVINPSVEEVDKRHNYAIHKIAFDYDGEGGLFALDTLISRQLIVLLPPSTPAPQQHYRPLLDPRPSEKPADTPADEWEFDKRRMYPQPSAVLSTTAGRVYVGVNYENGTAPLKWQAPKNGVRYEG